MASQTTGNWYEIDHLDQLDSPALVIYPDRVKENIRLLKTMIDDPLRLRPHAKTNKSTDATLLMMAAGINKFKCATIAEAEMLALCGAKDVLLAYQPVGPKLQRFAALVKKYPHTEFSCLVDNIREAVEVAKVFSAGGGEIRVYIDLDTGQHRTGIAPGEEAIKLYNYCAQLKGLTVAGLHAYDGHIHDQDFMVRTAACNEAFTTVQKMSDALMQPGYNEPVIIAGGSPTFPIHAKRKKVECSPGTFIFWDKGYSDHCAEQPFLPAAIFVTRVISLPGINRICTDLGHKSVAAENELSKRVFFLNAPDLRPVSQSEEHLVL